MMWLPAFLFLAPLIAASPDAQITPRAELHPRASADPSVLGWVSTSGASEFSELRSCDFPATLSTSGSFAQCCAPSGACPFFSSCSGGTLLAESTSVPCDNGVCNTGVIVPSIGAKSGTSNLGCWAESLGTTAFTMVQDIGSASVVPASSGGSSGGSSGSGSGSGSSEASSTGDSGSATGASSTGGSSTSPSSSNAATIPDAQSLPHLVGVIAGLFALL